MSKQSLIEAAKAYQHRVKGIKSQYSNEEEELCMAWLNGELRLDQVSHAMGYKSSSQAYIFLSLCAKQIFMKANKRKR